MMLAIGHLQGIALVCREILNAHFNSHCLMCTASDVPLWAPIFESPAVERSSLASNLNPQASSLNK
jgi:hypothetical protein